MRPDGTDARLGKGGAQRICPPLLDEHVVVREKKEQPLALVTPVLSAMRLPNAALMNVAHRYIGLQSH
jgi:hypothetical protein